MKLRKLLLPCACVVAAALSLAGCFFGGCSGKTFEARTDDAGEYVITGVPPATYESLMARVFDTDTYVFATTGLVGLSSAKYEVAADKTLPKGEYRVQLEAYNASDRKLAESARDIKFTVTDGAGS